MSEVQVKTVDVLTSQDVKDYLGIDWTDDAMERRIARTMLVADTFLEGAIGKEYPKDDMRAQELTLMIIADLFDHRELTQKERSMYRKLAYDFEQQIRLEMRD